MTQPKKYPVNLNIRLVLLVEPGEDGKYPSAFDVQDAVREAVIEHFNHDLIDDATEYNLEEKAERAHIDHSEITLHEEQPGDQPQTSEDGPRYWQADWNDEQAEGVRNALSMGELVSIANEDEGIIAYALLGYEGRVTDALNLKEPSANETQAQLITRRRAELVEAVLAKYPNADRLKVDIISDPNNRGYCIDDGWEVWGGEQQLGSFHDFVDEVFGGPFDQELNDYIDDAHITEDLTLNLKEQP